VIAVRRRKFFPLTEAEEAEFERVMYGGREKTRTAEAPQFAQPHPEN
jgi:hypothetical protein